MQNGMDDIEWPDVPDDLEPVGETLLPAEEDLPEDYRAGFVAVVGKPNVGKSTLMNRYVGQKVAIVSPKPQTTRRRILGIRTDDRAQIVFVDTPGIHEPLHKLGEVMVETARRAVPDADVVLFVVDAAAPPTSEDEQVAEFLREHSRAPVILALNKIDLTGPEAVAAMAERYGSLLDAAVSVPISATEGIGTEDLLLTIIGHLPPGPQYYSPDQVTDQPERIIGAELIREQVLHFTHEEVPHAVEVVIEEWKQRREGLTYISANVFVEKESQKGIVIGSGGSMLKRIGQAARRELERLVGHQVYLDLWVKVRKRWRKDENALRWLGHTVRKD
jgi:GTP-binding protein Era